MLRLQIEKKEPKWEDIVIYISSLVSSCCDAMRTETVPVTERKMAVAGAEFR